MTNRSIVGSCVFALLISTAAAAQERPNFSGTWIAQPDSSAAPGAKPAPPAFGPQFTVDQKGQEVTLTRTFAAGPATLKYTIGSETTSRVPGRLCEPDSGTVWTSAWDGNALALHMIGAVPPSGKLLKTDVKTTLRLESPDIVRVDTTARVPGQETTRVTSTTYRRSSTPAAAPPAPNPRAAKASIAQVAWISGTWVGTSTSGTTTFEERWTPAATGSMMAISRTLRDGAMSAFEFLCIVERDGGLVYQAMPNGRMPATDFTLTSIGDTNAVFENPAHDFPKMIRYTKRSDGSLEAVVSGDAGTKPQTFVFKRQE